MGSAVAVGVFGVERAVIGPSAPGVVPSSASRVGTTLTAVAVGSSVACGAPPSSVADGKPVPGGSVSVGEGTGVSVGSCSAAVWVAPGPVLASSLVPSRTVVVAVGESGAPGIRFRSPSLKT